MIALPGENREHSEDDSGSGCQGRETDAAASQKIDYAKGQREYREIHAPFHQDVANRDYGRRGGKQDEEEKETE